MLLHHESYIPEVDLKTTHPDTKNWLQGPHVESVPDTSGAVRDREKIRLSNLVVTSIGTHLRPPLGHPRPTARAVRRRTSSDVSGQPVPN